MTNFTFQDVCNRLKKQPAIAGLLTIGSITRGALAPDSDFDLVIVLREGGPDWFVGLTTIEDRLADLIFVPSSLVARCLALTTPVAAGGDLAPLLRWLAAGQIVFDHGGQLAAAQTKARAQAWVDDPDAGAAHAAWFALNYNLQQTGRLLAAADPLYRRAGRLRLSLFGPGDLWFGYFTIRRLPPQGDKDALRLLLRQDPAFLAQYEAFLGAVAPEEKLTLYRRAAALAAAPLGGLWPAGTTAFNVLPAPLDWAELVNAAE